MCRKFSDGAFTRSPFHFCISIVLVSSRCFLMSKKNIKKNGGKCARGNGERLSRNFAYAFSLARRKWEEAGGGERWVWAENFVEFFAHIAFHLQGELFQSKKTSSVLVALSHEGNFNNKRTIEARNYKHGGIVRAPSPPPDFFMKNTFEQG